MYIQARWKTYHIVHIYGIIVLSYDVMSRSDISASEKHIWLCYVMTSITTLPT